MSESIFGHFLTQLHLLSRDPRKAPGLDGKSVDKPDSTILTGEISPEPVMYVRRWEKTPTGEAGPPQAKHTEDWRREVAKAARSHSVRCVAWRFQCSTKTVIKCKKEFPAE
jgi:hypothetical protein